MAGINLSTQAYGGEKKKRSFFDRGFVFSVVLLVIILGVWGGIRYFLFTLNRDITALESQITDSKNELEGEQVDRVLNFDIRKKGIETNMGTNIDVAKHFQDLEAVVIPSVRLTQYALNQNTGAIVISGETSDYKYLAQQLISFKKQAEYSNIRVDRITTTESGDISFTLKADTLSQ